jgi:hypothetical protein
MLEMNIKVHRTELAKCSLKATILTWLEGFKVATLSRRQR